MVTRRGLVWGLALIAVLSGWSAAGAAGGAPGLTLRAAPADDGSGAVQLAAGVRRPDGTPAGDIPVHFFVRSDLFGGRLVHLETVATDTTGSAAAVYVPTWTGPNRFVARVGEDAVEAEAAAVVDVQRVRAPERPGEAPFAPVRRWLSVAVGGIALAVWGALAGLFLWVVRGIPARARTRAAYRVEMQHAGAGE